MAPITTGWAEKVPTTYAARVLDAATGKSKTGAGGPGRDVAGATDA